MFRILIVEDETLIAESLMMELQDNGLNVCGYATDGDEAIQMIKHESPDLILMDIYLSSEKDGIDIAKEVLKQNNKIKIIFVTGYNLSHFAARLDGVTYHEVMEKPVLVKDIAEIVHKLDGGSND